MIKIIQVPWLIPTIPMVVGDCSKTGTSSWWLKRGHAWPWIAKSSPAGTWQHVSVSWGQNRQPIGCPSVTMIGCNDQHPITLRKTYEQTTWINSSSQRRSRWRTLVIPGQAQLLSNSLGRSLIEGVIPSFSLIRSSFINVSILCFTSIRMVWQAWCI